MLIKFLNGFLNQHFIFVGSETMSLVSFFLPIHVPNSPVFRRACPFKRAFRQNRMFFALFFVSVCFSLQKCHFRPFFALNFAFKTPIFCSFILWKGPILRIWHNADGLINVGTNSVSYRVLYCPLSLKWKWCSSQSWKRYGAFRIRQSSTTNHRTKF